MEPVSEEHAARLATIAARGTQRRARIAARAAAERQTFRDELTAMSDALDRSVAQGTEQDAQHQARMNQIDARHQGRLADIETRHNALPPLMMRPATPEMIVARPPRDPVDPIDLQRRDTDTAFRSEPLSHSTCFDQLMLDDVKLSEWLDQHPEHIIIMTPPVDGHRWGNSAMCFSRSLIQQLADDPHAIMINCVPGARERPKDSWVVKIPMGEGFLAYVPRQDASYLVHALHVRIFQLRTTDVKFHRTESWAFANQELRAAVSGNHCQTGTELGLSRIRGIVQRS